jgi:hypothetical protein
LSQTYWSDKEKTTTRAAQVCRFREPRPFSIHTSRQIMRRLGRSDDRLRKYLFY